MDSPSDSLTDLQNQADAKSKVIQNGYTLENFVEDLQSSEYFNYYPVVKSCPGTDRWSDCFYLATPQNGG